MHSASTTASRRRATGLLLTALCVAAAIFTPWDARAADKWIEVTSKHVTIASRAGASDTKSLVWQIEQVRAAIVRVLPWAKVDLDRPLRVLAVDSEQKMRQLVPGFWERGGGVHPASVWVSAADQHYLAIRTDLEQQEQYNRNVNPYTSSYFSYVSLVLQNSLAGTKAPLWFVRGLAGVLSNTIVQDSKVVVGAPIPWHLDSLRERARLRLPALVAVTAASPELNRDEGLIGFDAQAWAFVHFLLFGNNGARQPKINQFFTLLVSGKPADEALAESIGRVSDLDTDYMLYVNRNIFSHAELAADVSVKREGFTQRTLPPAEAASMLAFFHVAMKRPAEARAAIAEARAADPSGGDSYAAEGYLLQQEEKLDEARAALERAAANKTTNAHAYYTLARLKLGTAPAAPAHDTLVEVEKLLARAIELNTRDAWAYALMGEVRSMLGNTAAIGLAARAVSLDPSQPNHRLAAARILWRAGEREDALKAVDAALGVATTEEDRRRATELQGLIRADMKR